MQAPSTTYRTLSPTGLDRRHVAMRLWEKAKRLGIWNPADIDLQQDAADWERLTDGQRDVTLQLAAQFIAGEEAVTMELLPLLHAMVQGGHLEDELYLTSFLFEEAKHVDFFQRWLDEVVGHRPDLHAYQGPSYERLFGEVFPAAMAQLYTDSSPVAQARASVTYNMIVEGVIAETGYYTWYTVLKQEAIMPGTLVGIQHIQRDEGRHIRFGVYLLSRLVAEHGAIVWDAIQDQMTRLLPLTIGILQEHFERTEAAYETHPYGLTVDQLTGYALGQAQKRMARLEKALGQSVEDICFG